MNDIATQGRIDRVEYGCISTYNANKQAVDRIKALSDNEFEKAIKDFSDDMQTFLRLVRERRKDI